MKGTDPLQRGRKVPCGGRSHQPCHRGRDDGYRDSQRRQPPPAVNGRGGGGIRNHQVRRDARFVERAFMQRLHKQPALGAQLRQRGAARCAIGGVLPDGRGRGRLVVRQHHQGRFVGTRHWLFLSGAVSIRRNCFRPRNTSTAT